MKLSCLILAGFAACSSPAFAAALPQGYQGQWSTDCADDESLGLGMYALEIDAGYVRIGFSECHVVRMQSAGNGLTVDLECTDIDGGDFAKSVVWRLEGGQKMIETVPGKPDETTSYVRCQ